MLFSTAQAVIDLPVADVVFREDLYPRIKHDPSLVQRYAANLDVLPPIEVNQHNILIDGWHRWTAHRSAGVAMIKAKVIETASDGELYARAVESNAFHGWQMDADSKRRACIDLYGKFGFPAETIARLVSWRKQQVLDATRGIREEEERRLNEAIFSRWMACESQQEIADALDVPQQTLAEKLRVLPKQFPGTRSVKLSKFDDAGEDGGFQPPLYNVWTFAKKSNEVGHFGNSEQRIVENLLYLYTEPFDIVVDPFAGGGSTIDVCKRRLRRYWASDRKPIVERESEIRRHDLVTDGVPPLNRRWSEVTLTYLDPPYWRQAAGEYSDDPTDLANMPLQQFTETLAGIVKDISRRQSRGVIALLIQPTQWKSDERRFADHVTDLVAAVGNKRLILENRVSCPYSTEQYNAQQVEWAKANRKLLVITRELIVWRLA